MNEILKRPKVAVYYRTDLNTGDWTAAENLYCTLLVISSASQPSRVEFEYRAGTGHQPGTSRQVWPPLSLGGKIVRVDLLDADDDAVQQRYYFEMQQDTRYVGGDASGSQPITQKLVATGLEDWLDLAPITGAYADLPIDPPEAFPTGKAIQTPISFNERYRRGYNLSGNVTYNIRAPFSVFGRTRDDLPAFEVLTAPTASDDLTLWTIKDILEYLIGFYCRSMNVFFAWKLDSPSTQDQAVAQALDSLKPPSLSVEGMTIKQVIDALISPARGLDWAFLYDTEADVSGEITPILAIWPVSDTEILLDGVSIPANTDTMALDLATDPASPVVTLGNDLSLQYGDVVVLGQPLLTCFSLSKMDGTLDRGWTQQEEDDYENAAKLANNAKPDYERLRNVYQRYVLIPNWDGMTGPGTGAGLGDDSNNPTTTEHGNINLLEFAPLVRSGHGFEPLLPILRQQQDESTPESEYTESFALLRRDKPGGGNLWEFSEKMGLHGLPACQFRVSNKELSVYVEPFEPREMSGKPGYQYNWKTDLIVTVAMRTNQRLYARRDMGGKPGRRLVLEAPDAEFWMISDIAAAGVKDGEIKDIFTLSPSQMAFPRADGDRLVEIAATVAAWYGRPRRPLSATWKGNRLVAPLGTMLDCTITSGGETISNALNQIAIDLANGTVTLNAEVRPLVPLL